MIKIRDETGQLYFEPSQHFLTLIKQHQTDIACEKLKGETVVQIHRKKKMLAGILDKLWQ